MIKRILLFVFVLFTMIGTQQYSAQQIINLNNFDDKSFHFGFALSFNNSSYYLRQQNTLIEDDSLGLLSELLVNGNTGFTLGVISSININPNFKVRFALPSLSFQERAISYNYLDTDSQERIIYRKNIRPVYLEFPAMMKFRTDRIGNWAMYGITGIRFGIDMASEKDVVNEGKSYDEQIIKLKKTDFGFEIGGGFDFFLQYFKLGVELKLGAGMLNIHQNENNLFDQPIGSLKSKVWTFSLTFEG
jgi:hypothetical protein